ncbi:MAG: DUF1289 domain-containing protein [Pseudomonadota bacterium]
MGKPPSPCIGVCKFKRAGRCIGCSMSEKQKKRFKKLDGRKKRVEFIEELVEQQDEMGKYSHWLQAYRKKCAKKGVPCPVT